MENMPLNRLCKGHLACIWDVKQEDRTLPCSASAENLPMGDSNFCHSVHACVPKYYKYYFGVTSKVYQVDEFTNADSMNTKDWLYVICFPSVPVPRPGIGVDLKDTWYDGIFLGTCFENNSRVTILKCWQGNVLSDCWGRQAWGKSGAREKAEGSMWDARVFTEIGGKCIGSDWLDKLSRRMSS